LELKWIYYEFLKLKSISKIIKGFLEIVKKISDTWQPPGVPSGMLTSP
jgi:hypothetical protein